MHSGSTSLVEGIVIRDWSQVTAELIFLYEGAIPTQYLDRRGYFDDFSALLIREGEATLETPHGEVIHAGPNDWVLAPQGERSQRFTPGSRVLSIHFLLTWPGRLPVYDWNGAVAIRSSDYPGMEEAGEQLLLYINSEIGVDGRVVRHTRKPFENFFGLYRHFFHWMEYTVKALAAQGIYPTRQGMADP